MGSERVLSELGLARKPLIERMQELQVPGVSIAVVDNGRVDWAEGFGECELGSGKPVTAETLFQAASISKPVFALAVMKLVSQGALDLDADVNRYLESWQLPSSGAWLPRVTLRQLLSHTAGTTVHGFPGYRRGDEVPTLTQILDGRKPANTRAVRVDTVPGVHIRYSGGGTTIAQLLVEDILGQPLAQTMRELVFEPLGLVRSTYVQPLPAELRGQAASAHEGGQVVEGGWHVYPEQAAAGLWTTPAELAQIGIAVGKSWRGEDTSFIPTEAVREMLSPQSGDEVPARGTIGVGYFLSGGPSWYYHHTGGNKGFVCNHKFSLASGQGYVMMTNGAESIRMCIEVELAVAREYGWPGYFPEISVLCGSYLWGNQGQIEVTADDEHLNMDLPGQGPLQLIHIGHGYFAVPDTGIRAAFGDNCLTLVQNERTVTARKAGG